MKSELKAKGFAGDKFFFGGHSLGGASMSAWANGKTDGVEGTFVWGSYASKSIEDPAKNFGAPLLTVGAEFDGWLARITRIALSFD